MYEKSFECELEIDGKIVEWRDIESLSFKEQLELLGNVAIPSVIEEIKDVAHMISELQEKQNEYSSKLKSVSKSIESKIYSDSLVKSCLHGSLKDYVKSEMERLYF